MNRVIKEEGSDRFLLECPGCRCSHYFSSSWQFDGNFELPTVSPSIRVNYGDGRVCHFFIRGGTIEFLSDCHHSLRGTIVDLPQIEGAK